MIADGSCRLISDLEMGFVFGLGGDVILNF